ncbi:MAG: pur operon repressor [Zhaonellaceae bacterium]|jgi:purine operon repressor|nr:pur operon repressor [Clostridia bacterium]
MRRSERIAIMTKILIQNPRMLFSLNYFAELFDAAKSTISEDLSLIKNTFQTFNEGHILTLAGAAGGVKYIPFLTREKILEDLEELAHKLQEPDRVLPGGYLYMTDIIFNPIFANKIGEIFATVFSNLEPDYLVTIETKGIPLALATAKAFNVPLVIIRDNSKVTEGSSVSINYVSGSTRRIQTMALARRSLQPGAKVLLIDDFMKAGGTAQGMQALMAEFKAEVLGLGILVGTVAPQEKLVDNYLALLELEALDEKEKNILIRPGEWIKKGDFTC